MEPPYHVTHRVIGWQGIKKWQEPGTLGSRKRAAREVGESLTGNKLCKLLNIHRVRSSHDCFYTFDNRCWKRCEQLEEINSMKLTPRDLGTLLIVCVDEDDYKYILVLHGCTPSVSYGKNKVSSDGLQLGRSTSSHDTFHFFDLFLLHSMSWYSTSRAEIYMSVSTFLTIFTSKF